MRCRRHYARLTAHYIPAFINADCCCKQVCQSLRAQWKCPQKQRRKSGILWKNGRWATSGHRFRRPIRKYASFATNIVGVRRNNLTIDFLDSQKVTKFKGCVPLQWAHAGEIAFIGRDSRTKGHSGQKPIANEFLNISVLSWQVAANLC